MTVMTREPLLTTQEAAKILNVSYEWLKKAAQQRTVPHTRVGRSVRFSHAQVDEIIANGARRAIGLPRGKTRSHL